MTDLTKITTPFGLLDAETQAALEAHGGPFEIYTMCGWNNWIDYGLLKMGMRRFHNSSVIRVKPPAKPSIDWSHVAPEYKWLARDKSGCAWLYKSMPHVTAYEEWGFEEFNAHAASALSHASYTPGTCDWFESLVERPE